MTERFLLTSRYDIYLHWETHTEEASPVTFKPTVSARFGGEFQNLYAVCESVLIRACAWQRHLIYPVENIEEIPALLSESSQGHSKI